MAGYTKTHSLDVTPTGDTVYAAIVNKVDKNDDDIITWINNLKKSYASSSAPTTPTPDEGQLWWDSANDILKVYDGSSWIKLADHKLTDADGDTYFDVEPSADSDAPVGYAAGNKWLDVTSAGIVGLPKQSYVRAYIHNGGSNFSVSASTWTKLPFDAEEEDVQGEYDPSTNYRFTATKAGKYLAIFTIEYYPNATPAVVTVRWNKNGAGYSPYYHIRTSAQAAIYVRITVIVEMSAGDYLEPYCYVSQDGTIYHGTSASGLFIAKIA